MRHQRTIKQPATIEGRGLFSGRPCRMRFLPAQAGEGVAFVRVDGETAPVRIPCDPARLTRRDRRTALANGTAAVETVEHVLSAVSGLGIDNLTIEVDAEEAPSIDGSALPFVEALQQAGLEEQDAPAEPFVIDEPIVVDEGDASLAALPGRADRLDVLFELDYDQTPSIGRQVLAFCLGVDDYASQIAPARTFLLDSEARQLRAAGFGTHLTAKDVLVIGADGPVDNELRFADEPVRHKLVDLIGDLAVLGRPLAGRVVSVRGGHELNHRLVRRLREAIDHKRQADEFVSGEPPMDIQKIMRLLPHRYPFLMIDRVIRMEGDRRAMAVKNVTINEPFFQGHYPGQPIMPGVMILEAMAQLSGLLLSRALEHSGKVAVLLSLDRVKMRRPARPGDQLLLEAEAVRVRPRTGHCRCSARIAGQLAAEAEIKFMLIDAEPVEG